MPNRPNQGEEDDTMTSAYRKSRRTNKNNGNGNGNIVFSAHPIAASLPDSKHISYTIASSSPSLLQETVMMLQTKYAPAYPDATYDTQGFCLKHPMIRVCQPTSTSSSAAKSSKLGKTKSLLRSKSASQSQSVSTASDNNEVSVCPLCAGGDKNITTKSSSVARHNHNDGGRQRISRVYHHKDDTRATSERASSQRVGINIIRASTNRGDTEERKSRRSSIRQRLHTPKGEASYELPMKEPARSNDRNRYSDETKRRSPSLRRNENASSSSSNINRRDSRTSQREGKDRGVSTRDRGRSVSISRRARSESTVVDDQNGNLKSRSGDDDGGVREKRRLERRSRSRVSQRNDSTKGSSRSRSTSMSHHRREASSEKMKESSSGHVPINGRRGSSAENTREPSSSSHVPVNSRREASSEKLRESPSSSHVPVNGSTRESRRSRSRGSESQTTMNKSDSHPRPSRDSIRNSNNRGRSRSTSKRNDISIANRSPSASTHHSNKSRVTRDSSNKSRVTRDSSNKSRVTRDSSNKSRVTRDSARLSETSEQTSRHMEEIARRCEEIAGDNMPKMQIVVPKGHPTNLKEQQQCDVTSGSSALTKVEKQQVEGVDSSLGQVSHNDRDAIVPYQGSGQESRSAFSPPPRTSQTRSRRLPLSSSPYDGNSQKSSSPVSTDGDGYRRKSISGKVNRGTTRLRRPASEGSSQRPDTGDEAFGSRDSLPTKKTPQVHLPDLKGEEERPSLTTRRRSSSSNKEEEMRPSLATRRRSSSSNQEEEVRPSLTTQRRSSSSNKEEDWKQKHQSLKERGERRLERQLGISSQRMQRSRARTRSSDRSREGKSSNVSGVGVIGSSSMRGSKTRESRGGTIRNRSSFHEDKTSPLRAAPMPAGSSNVSRRSSTISNTGRSAHLSKTYGNNRPATAKNIEKVDKSMDADDQSMKLVIKQHYAFDEKDSRAAAKYVQPRSRFNTNQSILSQRSRSNSISNATTCSDLTEKQGPNKGTNNSRLMIKSDNTATTSTTLTSSMDNKSNLLLYGRMPNLATQQNIRQRTLVLSDPTTLAMSNSVVIEDNECSLFPDGG